MSSVYLSECGNYFCRSVNGGGWPYEAWTIDGCLHWRNDNRVKTWADQKKFNHPMAYCVTAYHAELSDQKPGSFTLSLTHCDTTKVIEIGKGNTIIEDLGVVFRRKVPPQNVPKWLKECGERQGGL